MEAEPRRLALPIQGVTDKTSFKDQPPTLAPVDSLRNVMPFPGERQRLSLGTRFGTSKMFDAQFGNGNPVQSFCVVERAAGQTGLTPGPLADFEGTTRSAKALSGHCFVIDPVGSMYVAIKDERAIGGLASGVAWHPTDRKVAFLTYFSVPADSNVVTGLSMFNLDTLQSAWSTTGDSTPYAGITGSPGESVYGNHVVVGTRYTFVSGGRFVHVFKTDTGVFVKRYTCNNWANEVMWSGITADGNYLISVFSGAGRTTNRSLPNQPALTPDIDLSHFTSGAMKFRITSSDAEPLEQVQYGTALSASDPWFETNHGYLRFSEVLERAPRGCIPYAAALDSNDNLIVGMTNKGWGWTSTYTPDNSSTTYRNVAKFNSDGDLVWEVDANSRRVNYNSGANTWQNDIPQIDGDDDFKHDSADGTYPYTSTPKPSANAIAVDSLGDIYVAGQRNENPSTGWNVYKLRGDTGNIIWHYDAGSVVEQHAIAVDPTDDNLWVCVMRNADWTGHTASAILLKLDSIAGTASFHYDISPTPANGAWGVAVSSSGDVAFTTDYIA